MSGHGVWAHGLRSTALFCNGGQDVDGAGLGLARLGSRSAFFSPCEKASSHIALLFS